MYDDFKIIIIFFFSKNGIYVFNLLNILGKLCLLTLKWHNGKSRFKLWRTKPPAQEIFAATNNDFVVD